MNGILLVDKPQGMTSHDVVDALRKASRIRRIGHTGTLDPRATGLLILCIGQATRLSQFFSDLDKAYEGVMRLGVETSSHDLDGEVRAENPVPETLTREAIGAVCGEFVGDIKQIPPMVSAIKIGGRRLYKIARDGGEIERPARPVTIHCFDVTCWNPPDAGIRVACSSGAYVRTLCHDVGRQIGCGAALAQLRRMRVGRYSVENAAPLDAFAVPEDVSARLIPMDDALDMPEARVDAARAAIVRSGGAVSTNALPAPCPVTTGLVQIKDSAGKLIAIAQAQPTAMGARLQPKRVFGGK
ncbi:MAG TPA: tRNA pseudouridine(55) synthase TruB [Candidatus Hydrogenedentes bacterium]|nr:tRNA pseudouridine(55) synthase TruB [Candidatus Hydrogenedentota bacterium]